MNKALFLDRDGVINHDKCDVSFTFELNEFKILPDVFETIKVARSKGYYIVVITNQSGIGRAIYEHQHVTDIHDFLLNKAVAYGVKIDEIYYCPHHPTTSNCICRKPDSNLIEKAIARFNINAEHSIMVGDRPRDIEAAKKAGVGKTLLIIENSSLSQVLNLL